MELNDAWAVVLVAAAEGDKAATGGHTTASYISLSIPTQRRLCTCSPERINGDAFYDEHQFISPPFCGLIISKEMATVDMVIYFARSPKRTDSQGAKRGGPPKGCTVRS